MIQPSVFGQCANDHTPWTKVVEYAQVNQRDQREAVRLSFSTTFSFPVDFGMLHGLTTVNNNKKNITIY